MPRRCNPDLSKDWKIVLPATLAGSVEFELLDPATSKPRYGERSKLVAALLADWLEKRGKRIPVDLPSSDLYTKEPVTQSNEAPTIDKEALEKKLAALTPAELENRRREIVVSANGNYEKLSTDFLNELAFITSTLRRRTSGPPKAAKGTAKPKATLDSLLDL